MVCVMTILVWPLSREEFAVTVTMTDLLLADGECEHCAVGSVDAEVLVEGGDRVRRR